MDAARRLVKRVEQVRQHGALAGLEDDLRAHAGLQALGSQRLQPLRRDADARQVVGHVVGVIGQQIPGNGGHRAPNHQLGRMREGCEPDVHGLTRLDPVDHLRQDSRLQQQRRVLRDDIHDLVSWRDDASRRLEGEAHHLPVRGSLDLGAPELVAGGNVSWPPRPAHRGSHPPGLVSTSRRKSWRRASMRWRISAIVLCARMVLPRRSAMAMVESATCRSSSNCRLRGA
jgi:hypothetical protein